MEIKRIERGWAGHFCCAYRCLFHRNTLLKYGRKGIIISTVGLMKVRDSKVDTPWEEQYEEIGLRRYYETMVFKARKYKERWWDADVSKEIDFDSPWAIGEIDAEDKANDMHEKVVDEIMGKLEKGELK